MSQFDFGSPTSPLSGTTFINSKLEPWRDALHSNHSGTARPAYVVGGMIWVDTTAAPVWNLKLFDGAQDISIGTFNVSTHVFTPSANAALAANSVNTAAVAAQAITNAKLDAMAANTVKLNNTSGSASPADLAMGTSTILARLGGNIIAASITQILDLVTGTPAQGDILYRGASTYERLAAGTAGQVLIAQGTGANPTWSPSTGAGRLLNEIYFTQPTVTFTITTASPGVIAFGSGGSVGNPGSNTVNAGQTNQAVVLSTTGTLPAPLTAGTVYYLLAGNKLALTPGGTAINITLAGSGTHTIRSAPYVKGTNNPSFIIVEGVNSGSPGSAVGAAPGTYFSKKILNASLGASEIVDVGHVDGSFGYATSFGTAGALASTTVADVVRGAKAGTAENSAMFGGGLDGANNGAANTGCCGGSSAKGGSGLLKISEYS